ncbi:MAG: DUF190 domain-containing protein [Dehalococcoidia bacterium]|nr:DUF190 domain-containing protein [Dehalococcoidia bacterium]
MTLPEERQLIRIFIGETDKHDGMPQYEWIVRQAKERGLAGATVLHGVMGFGANSRLHTARILRLSLDLPIVVEMVDTEAKTEAFLAAIGPAIGAGMVTTERVRIRAYRADQRGAV